MAIELKIKAKHLAAEGRIISREVSKLKSFRPMKNVGVNNRYNGQLSRIDQLEASGKYSPETIAKWRKEASSRMSKAFQLHQHKTNVVRPVARRTHLARNFLLGNSLASVENPETTSTHLTTHDWDAIERMILRYGDEDRRVLKQRFEEWKNS